MWWVPLAMMGGSLIQGGMQANASRDASRAQTAANRDALGLQRSAAISQLQQMYPAYQGQVNALNRLYGMQGLPTIQAADLNALLAPYQNMQFGGAPGKKGGSKLRQIAFDPLDIFNDSAERALFDPLDIF